MVWTIETQSLRYDHTEIIMMSTLRSLVAPQVVIMTTLGFSKRLCCIWQHPIISWVLIWASGCFIIKPVIFNDFIENLAHDMTSSHMWYPVHISSQSSLWSHKTIIVRRVWYRVETVTATNKGISVSVILNMWHWPYERNNPYLKFDFFYIWYLCHMISK